MYSSGTKKKSRLTWINKTLKHSVAAKQSDQLPLPFRKWSICPIEQTKYMYIPNNETRGQTLQIT